MLEWKDDVIYDELRNVVPGTAVVKGDGAVKQDVFGFYVKDRETVGEEVVLIYRCRQVEATKKVGTDQAILSGDKLYWYLADGHVSPVKGTVGVDCYFCGWAKEDAGANAITVLMNFDGTRYNEDI